MKSLMTLLALALFVCPPTFANSQMAKNVLSQNTTNPFCSAGYDGPNPYEKNRYQQPDPSKSICKGMDVIDCYREKYKNRR